MRAIKDMTAALLCMAVAAAGCGGDEKPHRARAAADRPVPPAPGWRTVRNKEVGFTLAVPRSWPARSENGRTVIRSRDRLVAVSATSDRSSAGRETPSALYARETLRRLPGFDGRISSFVQAVPGSPYLTARVEGRGTISASKQPQRISVIAYRRLPEVTYVLIVFRNARLGPAFAERTIRRMLRSFRGPLPDRSR